MSLDIYVCFLCVWFFFVCFFVNFPVYPTFDLMCLLPLSDTRDYNSSTLLPLDTVTSLSECVTSQVSVYVMLVGIVVARTSEWDVVARTSETDNTSDNCRKHLAFRKCILLALFSNYYKAGGLFHPKKLYFSPMHEKWYISLLFSKTGNSMWKLRKWPPNQYFIIIHMYIFQMIVYH